MSQPRTAIVIVNWNKKEYLLRLLGALRTLRYENDEVIVVDNASTDSSVEVLAREFPDVTIIRNETNLGGTGGFNTGIRYVIGKGRYKYVWLLDNDALVEKNTLLELVRIMEEDDKIGIAGSMIVDSDDRDLIVELGGFFRWDTIGVIPHHRNRRIGANLEPTEVEYVAICSALVRVDAIQQVGLMDERFFVFWDDMDWGLSFRRGGFKVVAIPTSIVYHPAFTEKKRGEMIDRYYGCRNGLLAYTKHTGFLKRLRIFYNFSRTVCTGVVFSLLTHQTERASLSMQALGDFISNRWGKIGIGHEEHKNKGVNSRRKLFGNGKKIRKIIVSTLGATRDDALLMIAEVRKMYQDARVVLLLADDRKDVFELGGLEAILVDSKRLWSIPYMVWAFSRILGGRYDLIVGTNPSAYFLAVRKGAVFSAQEKAFFEEKMGIASLFVAMVSLLVGELCGAVVLPVIVLKACVYRQGERG